jgi:hypothetical protein
MASKKTSAARDKQDQIVDVDEARRYQAQREQTYRAQALKLYPWICARCGREFSGKKLRELTVHHKDHHHDNNPLDGSNWELLCLYCHENEHVWQQVADVYGEAQPPVRTVNRCLRAAPGKFEAERFASTAQE